MNVLAGSSSQQYRVREIVPTYTRGNFPPHTSLQIAFCEEFSFTVLLITKASQENTLMYYETLLFFAK